MSDIRRLMERLEADDVGGLHLGGNAGLRLFLQHADPRVLTFEEGEPTNPSNERVSTYVSILPTHANSIVLLLYPMTERVGFSGIALQLNVPRNAFNQADEEALRKIGMSPGRCHPFPDPRLVSDDGIDLMFMERTMLSDDAQYNFPVYSPIQDERDQLLYVTGGDRIGSVYMSPVYYLENMQRLVGPDKIRPLHIVKREEPFVTVG